MKLFCKVKRDIKAVMEIAVKSLLIFQAFSTIPISFSEASPAFLSSIFQSENEELLEDGLDPAEYFRLKQVRLFTLFAFGH